MTQNELILNHLKNYGSITPLEAFNNYGCLRLSGRIYDLKQEGHEIKSTLVESCGKHFSKYSLKQEVMN